MTAIEISIPFFALAVAIIIIAVVLSNQEKRIKVLEAKI